MSQKRVRAFGPASVANWGVGFDALGAALDGPGDVATVYPSRKPGARIASIEGDGGRLPADPERNTASVAAQAVLDFYRRNGGSEITGLEIELIKGLPLSSGLGSSAASAVAAAYASARLLGISEKEFLLEAVLLGEKTADGAWHGDNAFASLMGGIVLVPTSNPKKYLRVVPLPVPARLRLVLAHPSLELSTAESRRVLPKSVSMGLQVSQGAAFAELISALFTGDLKRAGQCISSDQIVEPARAPLVPGYDAVTAAMRESGALGIALAGAGPTIMALSEDGPDAGRISRAAVAAWKAEGVEATARVHCIDMQGAREIP